MEREFQRRVAEYNDDVAAGSASVTANLPNASHGILANSSNKGRGDEEEKEEPRQIKVVRESIVQGWAKEWALGCVNPAS